jgi:drug/metabolite transporter (DMT)-like permease
VLENIYILLFYILMGLVTFFWGLTFPMMKIGLFVMQPFTFLLLRSIVSSVVIFSLILVRKGTMLPPQGRPEFWWNTLLHNMMFIFVCHGALITTSGRTSVFLYTQPLFYVTLVAWFIPSERFGLRTVFGFVVAFAGIIVLFSEKFGTGGVHTFLGDGFVIIGAMIWGLQSFYLRQNLKGIDPFRIAAWTQLVAVPLFLFFALIRGAEIPDFTEWKVIATVGYNGVVGTGLVMVLWVRLLAEYAPSRVGSFMFLTPVFGVFLSSLILFEPLTGFMMSGAALVALGVYLVNIKSSTSLRERNLPLGK